jgi:RpiR family transcriptional regulator, carbohydrate utilization regulator
MSVMTDIKTVYNELKPVQKKIADYFLNLDFEGLHNSIEVIAGDIGTSVASISRFCKYIGYDSFKRFKMTFSRDLQYEPVQVLPIFHQDDEPELSVKKVFAEAITNIQATEGALNTENLIRVAERLRAAEMIYFFGFGGSGKVGELGEIQFSHLGYRAKSVIDPYEMMVCAGHTNKGDVFICISHTGRQKQLIEAAGTAQANGAMIIGITNYGESPLAVLADMNILTACHERQVHFAQSNSMVAQLTLIRALYILIASKSAERIINKVGTIESIVNKNLRVK